MFSVIIPVYMVEKYIKQCVNSVLNQTFNDFEIILVDDGSRDKCPEICNNFAQLDSRVKVIHKKNGGLSSARNAGISIAVGRYVLFLDSDDYWNDQNVLQNLNDIIAEKTWVDIVSFSATLLYPSGAMVEDSFQYEEFELKEGNTAELEWLIKNDLIIGSACTKAIRREFLLENKLFFKENIKSEDIEWVFRVSCTLPKYFYHNSHFYVYRQAREGSISNTVTKKHIKQYFEIITTFCDGDKVEDSVKKIFMNYVAYQFSILCAYIINLDDKNLRIKLIDEAKKYKFLFDYDIHPKMKRVNQLYRFVGFKATCICLGVYMVNRRKLKNKLEFL